MHRVCVQQHYCKAFIGNTKPEKKEKCNKTYLQTQRSLEFYAQINTYPLNSYLCCRCPFHKGTITYTAIKGSKVLCILEKRHRHPATGYLPSSNWTLQRLDSFSNRCSFWRAADSCSSLADGRDIKPRTLSAYSTARCV